MADDEQQIINSRPPCSQHSHKNVSQCFNKNYSPVQQTTVSSVRSQEVTAGAYRLPARCILRDLKKLKSLGTRQQLIRRVVGNFPVVVP
jgi:hypothetical protein